MNQEEKHPNKCPICGRPTHKESKYCIFHAGAEEKTEEEFKKALKQFIEEIKLKNIVYDFMGFVFIGNNDFRKDYNVKQFNNLVRFDSAIFHGKTSFSGITFNDYAIFMRTTFHGDAEFIGVNFQNDAIFNYANFNKVHFNATNFKWNAIFNESSFKWAFFPLVNFYGKTQFGNLKKLERMHFTETKFSSGISSLFGFKEGKATFNNALLENISLSLKLGKDAIIDFENTRLSNTNIKRKDLEGHIKQENEEDFVQAKEIYLLIKNNFHSIGRYDDESWAYIKERDMEKMSKSFYSLLNKYKKHSLFKKIFKEGNLLKRVIIKLKIFSKWLFSKKAFEWFHLSFSNFIYRYGESPRRVIRFALIIIFLFAILLNISGIVNSDRTNLIIEIIKENQGDGYTLRYLGPILESFLNCLYFSVVTFTTLGYGDFQPAVGLSRFFVSVEAIIGAFTMTLFVYTFARRTGGR